MPARIEEPPVPIGRKAAPLGAVVLPPPLRGRRVQAEGNGHRANSGPYPGQGSSRGWWHSSGRNRRITAWKDGRSFGGREL